MARGNILLMCLLTLVVAAAASGRNATVQYGIEASYGGPIGGRDWGHKTVIAFMVLNVTKHPIRNVKVRAQVPGMKLLKRSYVSGATATPIRTIPGGVTFTIRQVDPLVQATIGLHMALTAKPGHLECSSLSLTFSGKNAKWGDRGWCWTQAP